MISEQDAAKKLAEEKENQKNYYSVIVDGNRHHLGQVVRMKKEDGVSVKRCQEVVNKVEKHFGIKVEMIEIYMDEWDLNVSVDYYISSLFGDVSIKCLRDKKAKFYVNKNCLQIWEDGMPVYENNNGIITKDRDALADCLM